MSNLKKQVFTNIKFTHFKKSLSPTFNKNKTNLPKVDKFPHYSSYPLLADFTYNFRGRQIHPLLILFQESPTPCRFHLQVCCSVLQCVAVCCRVMHYVAVCCSVLQCLRQVTYKCAVCCSVLQCVAVCCIVLQCVAVCCSVYVRSSTALTFEAADTCVAVINGLQKKLGDRSV